MKEKRIGRRWRSCSGRKAHAIILVVRQTLVSFVTLFRRIPLEVYVLFVMPASIMFAGQSL